LSLAPKSVTTPIAMGIAERIGGIPSLTAVLVIATGILGAVGARYVFDAMRCATRRFAALPSASPRTASAPPAPFRSASRRRLRGAGDGPEWRADRLLVPASWLRSRQASSAPARGGP
jgi:hypothetical protein